MHNLLSLSGWLKMVFSPLNRLVTRTKIKI